MTTSETRSKRVYGYDDEFVVTHMGIIEVDGVFVQSSVGFYRDVRLGRLAMTTPTEYEPLRFEITPPPPGQKWCSGGHWVDREGFSPDARNRDGLHSHCKACRAEHARRMREARALAEGRHLRRK